MNTAILSAVPSASAISERRVHWFAIVVLGLLWIEFASRLRFEWTINPQYGYGWTVPFLTAFLFWRRWQTAPVATETRSRFTLPGLIMAAAACLLPVRLIQEANPDWRLLSWTMALLVVVISSALIYLAGGPAWLRHFAFPIAFFLVAVPWPTQFEQAIIQGLMRADAAINVEFLNAIGISAVQLGNVIEVGSGFVGIDEACTGIRSLQATFMISLFLGEFYAFSLTRRVLLVMAGAFLAFGCNLIRTFLLVWLGAEHGSQTIKNWHDPAGMSILMICLFALWGLALMLRDRQNQLGSAVASPQPRRISRLLVASILVALIAAELGTQLWYGIHETRSVRMKPWTIGWPDTASAWKSVPVAESAQDLLRYNEGGGGAWTAEDGHSWTMYFFRWLPGRTAGLFVKNHRPDVCLPASGMTQRGDVVNRIWEVNGVQLPIRSYVFESGGASLHVFYCYWDGSAPGVNDLNQENWTARGRIEAARRGKRDVGAQMLELVASGYEDLTVAERAARAELAKIVRRG